MPKKANPKSGAEIIAALDSVPALAAEYKKASGTRNGCMSSIRATIKRALPDACTYAEIAPRPWDPSAGVVPPYVRVVAYGDSTFSKATAMQCLFQVATDLKMRLVPEADQPDRVVVGLHRL